MMKQQQGSKVEYVEFADQKTKGVFFRQSQKSHHDISLYSKPEQRRAINSHSLWDGSTSPVHNTTNAGTAMLLLSTPKLSQQGAASLVYDVEEAQHPLPVAYTKLDRSRNNDRKRKLFQDDMLDYMCDKLSISTKRRDDLKKSGIFTFSDAFNRIRELQHRKISSLHKRLQEDLYYCCLWYQNFQKENLNNQKNWREDFDRDSLEEFIESVENQELSSEVQHNIQEIVCISPSSTQDGSLEQCEMSQPFNTPSGSNDNIDPDLQFLYDEAPIRKTDQEQLQVAGIVTIDNVLNNRNNFKQNKYSNVSETTQEQLYLFCYWYEEEFGTEEPHKTSWRASFAEVDFVKLRKQIDERVKSFFGYAKVLLHEGNFSDFKDFKNNQFEYVYDYVVQLTMEQLPRELVNGCHFDVIDLINTCARAIFNFPSGKPHEKIQLVCGKTQSGKSKVKAVIVALCKLLNCPCIIITKGVSERKDLANKVQKLLAQSGKIVNPSLQEIEYSSPIVLNDTGARIEKGGVDFVKQERDRKPHLKFVMICDECDALYRTHQRIQRMEQALDQLVCLGPALRVEISATPIPTMLSLEKDKHDVDLLLIGTSEDYSGIIDMKPLYDKNNRDNIYLTNLQKDYWIDYKLGNYQKNADPNCLFPPDEVKEVEEVERFSECANLKKIPSTNDSVMKLYDNALDNFNCSKKGVLLLDCTNFRVRTEYNIMQKAACVQNYYAKKDKKIIIVVSVGNGIYIRRPGYLHGRKIPNSITITAVLNKLDKEFGLDVPIFVFGYVKMRRCISYRSDRRVPTHMVIWLGLAHSNENFIQAIGRATFNGKDTVLRKNGFDHVTILTSKNDMEMAIKYQNFVSQIADKVQQGETTSNSLTRPSTKFDDLSNYLRHSNRKTGQNKLLKYLLPSQEHFVPPSKDEYTKHYSEGSREIQILRVIRRLVLRYEQSGNVPCHYKFKNDFELVKDNDDDDDSDINDGDADFVINECEDIEDEEDIYYNESENDQADYSNNRKDDNNNGTDNAAEMDDGKDDENDNNNNENRHNNNNNNGQIEVIEIDEVEVIDIDDDSNDDDRGDTSNNFSSKNVTERKLSQKNKRKDNHNNYVTKSKGGNSISIEREEEEIRKRFLMTCSLRQRIINEGFTVREITKRYNNTYYYPYHESQWGSRYNPDDDDEKPLRQSDVKKILSTLKDDLLVQKIDNKYWAPKNWDVLMLECWSD